MERYRRRTYKRDKEKMPFKKRLIRQGVACAVIFVVVFIISLLKTDTAEVLKDRIDYTLSYTVDYKGAALEIIEHLKSFSQGE